MPSSEQSYDDDEEITNNLIINTNNNNIEDAEDSVTKEEGEMTTSSLSSDVDIDDDGAANNSTAGRYFSDLLPTGPTCHNCGQQGHIARECGQSSLQPCFLCGQLGHSRSDCPEDLCYNCLRPGHQSRDCSQPKRRRFFGDHEVCNECGLPGHIQRDCSLSWRQYVFKRHLRRNPLEPKLVSCYWCAGRDHFGDECPERSRGGFSVFHYPSSEYMELVAYKFVVGGADKDKPAKDQHRRRSQSPRKHNKNLSLDNRGPKPNRASSNHSTNYNSGNASKQHRPMYRGGYQSSINKRKE